MDGGEGRRMEWNEIVQCSAVQRAVDDGDDRSEPSCTFLHLARARRARRPTEGCGHEQRSLADGQTGRLGGW